MDTNSHESARHRTLRSFVSIRGWLTILVAAISSSAVIAEMSSNAMADTSSEPLQLCVASVNLRYASTQRPNSWTERRPVMRDCLRELAPDLIGTQEGLHAQLLDLATDLPDYDWIGTGRDGGNNGEFMAIFYKRDRFEPLATNHFWLSDTPEVVASSTWSNACKRMVTWVRFREKPSGREFYFWNTHLDHEVELARQKSADLIRQRISELPQDIPVLLTGDFNCAGGNSRAYDILVKEGGLADTWRLAEERVNERLNTFNGFRPPQTNGVRIDWILARGDVSVDKAEIVTFSRDGQFPSDHFPIVTWLTLR
jgi:endonuclease/exonuclease/phosphatase family metal-dependent hydrolase